MKKVFITTLGCKVNQYESASFLSGLTNEGHIPVKKSPDADIIIINTCCVTTKAAAQSRQEIRKAIRNNKKAKILVTGCYAQLACDEIETMQEIQTANAVIIGNSDKHRLVEKALDETDSLRRIHHPIRQNRTLTHLPVTHFDRRTRAYIKIQDGCNAFCSYCIVPYTRGRSRSLPPEKVLQQAKIFQQQGYKEIVVTGIHVGAYGRDLASPIDIADIMQMMCAHTPEIRYRLSSIEPLEISDKLLKTMLENDNFMPHLHIPLQSADDGILFRMNRRYTTAHFSDIVLRCQKTIPDLALGIDVIAGFPGESETVFAASLAYLQELQYTYLHVFPYSKRTGTPAAAFDEQVDKETKAERVKQLCNLSAVKKDAFYQKHLGEKRKVLVEARPDKKGLLHGFTDNYIPVSFHGEETMKNKVLHINLETVINGQVQGNVCRKGTP